MNDFGNYVRDNRNAKGLSRVELAADLGISYATVAKIEQGAKNASPKMKRLIEEYFEKKREADMPDWMWLSLEEIAKETGTTPGDIINILVYKFIKETSND